MDNLAFDREVDRRLRDRDRDARKAARSRRVRGALMLARLAMWAALLGLMYAAGYFTGLTAC